MPLVANPTPGAGVIFSLRQATGDHPGTILLDLSDPRVDAEVELVRALEAGKASKAPVIVENIDCGKMGVEDVLATLSGYCSEGVEAAATHRRELSGIAVGASVRYAAGRLGDTGQQASPELKARLDSRFKTFKAG